MEPAKLTKLVRGELDWIVMKCLEKDRNRRYETANSFAMDVQRYLADEAVLACPPSTGYRLRKFARRNKRPMLAALTVFLLLVGGIAGTTVGLLVARQQREDAKREANRAGEAERLASHRLAQVETEKQRADEERAVAEAVSDFLQNDLLGQAVLMFQSRGANGKRDPNMTVRTALDRAAERVALRFANQPRVEAAIRATLARAYYELGFPIEARIHAERSVALRVSHLGADHADTLWSQIDLALVLNDLGFFERMEAILLEVIRRQTATLGPGHLETIKTKNVLASFSLDPIRPNLARAAELLEEVVQKRTEQLGPDHNETLISKQNLAWLYRRQEEYDRAAALFRELLDVYRNKFGDDDPNTLLCKSNLGLVYLAHGKLDQAEPILLDVLQKRIALEGDDNISTHGTRYFLAKLYREQRKYDRAVPLFERALTAYRKQYGATQGTFFVVEELARTHLEAGQPEKALPLVAEAVNGMRQKLGANSREFAAELVIICEPLLKNGQYPEAEKHLRECLAISAESEPDVWSTFNARSMLGAALLGQKKYAEAEPLLRQGYEGMKRREADIPPPGKARLAEAVERLVRLYVALDKADEADEAARWRKELEALRKAAEQPVKPKDK
jgi:non-specific serine/threonine protein kinase/serine/threonine-protein kinase